MATDTDLIVIGSFIPIKIHKIHWTDSIISRRSLSTDLSQCWFRVGLNVDAGVRPPNRTEDYGTGFADAVLAAPYQASPVR